MTTEAERQLLLRIAREAITAHANGSPFHGPPGTDLNSRRAGAFVTLHSGGELRGCIGHVEANESLPRIVERCAIAACSADPRFPPVSPSEVAGLAIEVSLLGPLESISSPHEIEIGHHGLVVERGSHRGLLLPQVATEWKWDVEAFLAQTCRKAGLPQDAWKNGASLWRFAAEVFSE